MPIEVITVVMFLGLIVGLILGIPVSFVLGAVGVLFILFLWGPEGLATAGYQIWGIAQRLILIAIPMFILMANILRHSGIGDDMYDMMYRWSGGLRGGLAIGTVAICAMVGAMSGISGTATLMMGMIAVPSMRKYGYDKRLAVGCVSGGGSLGVLIPPSVMMCFYGLLTNTSVGKLFMGGLFPGLMLAGGFMLYIAIRCALQPSLAPALPPEERASWGMKFASLKALVMPIFLIMAVLGSIFFGLASVTEASVLGVVGSIICAIVNRRFNLKMLRAALTDGLQTSAMALWVLVGAFCFSTAYTGLGAIDFIGRTILAIEAGPLIILGGMMVLLVILGCFMDSGPIIMIATPVFIPIIHGLGFNPIWFGILFVINMEMGMLTPPFGFNLFYMRAITPRDITMVDIYISMIPFIIIQMIGLVIVIFVPQIALWLPALMIRPH